VAKEVSVTVRAVMKGCGLTLNNDWRSGGSPVARTEETEVYSGWAVRDVK